MRDTGHVCDFDKRRKRFIDGCHYVVIEQTCKECGALHETGSERDFRLNPLQIAFAREDCARCRELAAGVEPASWKEPCAQCRIEIAAGERTERDPDCWACSHA